MARAARLVLLTAAIALAACTPLALLPVVTPLLSIALSSRGNDAISPLIADLEKRQDWQGLAGLAQQRLQLDPGDADGWFILGYAQIRLGEFARSAEAYSKVVERAPEDIDAWNMLGESQRLAGRADLAMATLDRAVTIDPRSPATRYLLGEACRDAGRMERAITAYRDAVRLEPRFAPGWFGLGMVLARVGPKGELPAIVERLRELDPVLGRELARTLQHGNE